MLESEKKKMVFEAASNWYRSGFKAEKWLDENSGKVDLSKVDSEQTALSEILRVNRENNTKQC